MEKSVRSTKAEKIRECLAEDPGMPTETVMRRTKATKSQVYSMRHFLKKSGKLQRKTAPSTNGHKDQKTDDAINISDLVMVAKIRKSMGMEKLQRIFSALEQIGE